MEKKMAESIQQKLTKVKPPRVQITYDLEVGGSEKKTQIPFVVQVMGNFSGHKKKSPEKIKNMSSPRIDQENFDVTLASIRPRLKISVDNKISNVPNQLKFDIEFRSMNDFTPGSLANNLPKLKEIMQVRQRLLEIQSKIDGSETVENAMLYLAKNSPAANKINSTPDREAEAQLLQ